MTIEIYFTNGERATWANVKKYVVTSDNQRLVASTEKEFELVAILRNVTEYRVIHDGWVQA